MIEDDALELQQARCFMQWVTQHEPVSVQRLDKENDRKRPDFAFYYPSGQVYILELTRWLTLELLELEDFLKKEVAGPLDGSLPGTFVLHISTEDLKGGRISKSEAANLVSEVRKISRSDIGAQTCRLTTIGSLSRVRNDGHSLCPMIQRQELLYPSDEETEALQKKLQEILVETDEKLRSYCGTRVLLLDILQCGLDIEYHARSSKEGPGEIIRWVTEASRLSTRIDYICVSQGMRVWDSAMNRLLTGHKYVDMPTPNYKEVWRRSELPHITDMPQGER